MDYAIKVIADIVIIGGDIAPKHFSTEQFISGQRKFLKDKLLELLTPLKERLPNCKIFLMMGNDDCIVNTDILEENDGKIYHLIHNKRIELTEDFDIVGYSFVPITPFGIKDWEKYDFSKVPKKLEQEYLMRKMTNYRLDGKKSTKEGWKDLILTSGIEKEDSIQKDLSNSLFTENLSKTIYVIHCPPNKTSLDQLTDGSHVGSFAVRQFIEKYQPYLTLHGHIHESVEVSGSFKDKISKTLCMASGNYNVGEQLALLVFDLYNPEDTKRLVI